MYQGAEVRSLAQQPVLAERVQSSLCDTVHRSLRHLLCESAHRQEQVLADAFLHKTRSRNSVAWISIYDGAKHKVQLWTLRSVSKVFRKKLGASVFSTALTPAKLNAAGWSFPLRFTEQQRLKHKSNRPWGSRRGRQTSSWSPASLQWFLCVVATVWTECCWSAGSDPSAEPPSPPSGTTSCCGVLRSTAMPTRTWE